MKATTSTPQVIIEKTSVHQKQHAPKGSIYFVARCKHNDTLHSIWFLAKKAILFNQDEIELRQHLTDQLLEIVAEKEREATVKQHNSVFTLNKVIAYIKRFWFKRSQTSRI